MATFNEFKNNSEILRKTFQKMNSVTESEIRPQWIEENFLKENNPHIFLQLLHYILIDFSPFVIFVKVLDYYPTIKDDNDKKFVSNVMTLGRKMFGVDVKIDIDQFLSQKFVEKKTEWMAQFCKSVYEMYLKESKNGLESKSFGSTNVQKKTQKQESLKEISKRSSNFATNDDNSDDEAPRNLNILPSDSRKPIVEKTSKTFSKKQENNSSSDEDMKELLAKKSQLSKIKEKTNKNEQKNSFLPEEKCETIKNHVKPQGSKMGNFDKKNMHQEEEEDDETINEYLPKSTFFKVGKPNNFSHNKNPISQIPEQDQNEYSLRTESPNESEESPKEYVTREELMEIMSGVSKNFSEILTKFNEFQSQVGGWVQNINAKISIIEENVKTIKNNL